MNVIFNDVALDFRTSKLILHFNNPSTTFLNITKINECNIEILETVAIRAIVQRPMLLLLVWEERNGNIVTQVHDYENGIVHSSWISIEGKMIALTGTVKPLHRKHIPILLVPWLC